MVTNEDEKVTTPYSSYMAYTSGFNTALMFCLQIANESSNMNEVKKKILEKVRANNL